MDFWSQCGIPKTPLAVPKPAASANILNKPKSNNKIIGPTSFLSHTPNSTGGIHMRTLSSIYRAKVNEAFKNKRIFTVHGSYNSIRQALLDRGWLEKLAPSRYPKLQNLSEYTLLAHAKRGNDFEAVALSKIMNHFPSFFIWQPRNFVDLHAEALPHRNRVRREKNFDFCTKVGLIGCAEQEHWYKQDGLSDMLYPRFYRIGGNKEDRQAFTEDFRQTQCRSLIKFVIENKNNLERLIADGGCITTSILIFALTCIKRQLNDWEHNSLDATLPEHADEKWTTFLSNSKLILQRKSKFKATLSELVDYVKISQEVLEKLEAKRADYKWDGCRNLWILKPGHESRGIGILIRNSLNDILQWISNNPNRRYIVQKYIERPLLIYKTKFDIRQYMLLTIGESTVKIWLYKDCYLKFSGQEFSTDDLRECVHLTNNTVQKRYKNKSTRDARLPKCNMWSLEQLKVYLKNQYGSEDIWNNKIYPGFCQNVIAVVSSSFEETNFIENAFELYGCDFMLDQQCNPILIEVNSTPDLSPSTDVTARLCPMVTKDLVKVIVDLPHNSRASTGGYELVYEVNYQTKQSFDPKMGLVVNGKQMNISHVKKITPINTVQLNLRAKKKVINKKIKAATVTKPTKHENSSSKIAQPAQKLKAIDNEALALR